jgi:hypothetical protein
MRVPVEARTLEGPCAGARAMTSTPVPGARTTRLQGQTTWPA